MLTTWAPASAMHAALYPVPVPISSTFMPGVRSRTLSMSRMISGADEDDVGQNGFPECFSTST